MARGCRAEGLWINPFSVQMERTQTLRAWTARTFSASRKFRMAAAQRQLHRVLSKSFNPTTASPKPLHQIRPLASTNTPGRSQHRQTGFHSTSKPSDQQTGSRLGASRKAEGWDYSIAQEWGWQSWKSGAGTAQNAFTGWLKIKYCCGGMLCWWPIKLQFGIKLCLKDMRWWQCRYCERRGDLAILHGNNMHHGNNWKSRTQWWTN